MQRSNKGFTLVEMTVAASILVVSISMAMAGFVYFLSETHKADTQSKLDINVQVAIEQIRRSIRLTSLEQMFFYPAGIGPYSAMSFPLATDDDGDGAIDLDANGDIIWDQTYVYHVWTGMPTQLRLTRFHPRDDTLTDEQRQQQINAVALTGSGTAAPNGSNSTTKVIFENVFTWSIHPRSATFDGYAPDLSREEDVYLGSIVLSNGSHDVSFTVIATNPASSGFKIGIDNLIMSPSYSTREAEAQLPASAQSGATAAAQYMGSGSWDGNYQLYFPATDVGDTFTLTMENDRWEETNFRATGERHENTTVEFNSALSPSDFVVSLEGMQTNWLAQLQTGDTNAAPLAAGALRGTAVRVLIRGDEMENGNWILTSGGKCMVNFRSGTGQLSIEDAFIAETVTSSTNTMDAAAGTMTRLTFSGANHVTIPTGSSVWSDLTAFSIDKHKSYLVSFLVNNAVGHGNGYVWADMIAPGLDSTFIIPFTSSPDADDADDAIWSTRGDVVGAPGIASVQYMYATYPSNGVYTSSIFDSVLDAANYQAIDWSEVLPSGTDITLKVRSGNSNNLADASAWAALSPIGSPGSINPGDKRYVQFQAALASNSDFDETPFLRDTTIRWEGDQRVVDIGGSFTKGPDYGVFEVKVNGQALKQGVVVDLEIFEYVRSHGGETRITSALSTEVTPRNSGR